MNERRKQRLTYIDWMRGLACLLMFQTHCYDMSRHARPRIQSIYVRRCFRRSFIAWCSGEPSNERTPKAAFDLYRLDARPGVPAHVSDALLRLLAERRGAFDQVFQLVAARRNPSGAVVPVSGGDFLRPSDRQTSSARRGGQRDRPVHAASRRGDLWARAAVSGAGVLARATLGRMDRSAAALPTQ